MTDTFSIGVATFGGQEWIDLAHQRALPSARAQGVPVLYAHGETLAEARNDVLAQAQTTFLIHLDADDELEPGYVDAMARGTADLRAPRIRQVRRGRPRQPFMPQVWGHTHACVGECLRHGNFMVIGTAVRAALLRQVGGWEEWGWSEDWAAWARCWAAGGTVETIPDAIYRAHVRPGSRNHALSSTETVDWHRQIEAAIWPQAA
jgi:hypothetical protein